MGQSIVDELVTLLGFKVDPNAHPTAAKFTRTIDSIGKYALAASASIMAAASAVLFFAEKSAKAGADIQRFSEKTGASVESIQKWSYAAQMISGDKQSILNDIQNVTAALNPIMPGDFNQGLYLMFGSRLKEFKDANQLFGELAKVFSHMTAQKSQQWGRLIGLDPNTVMTLRSGDLPRFLKEAKASMLSPKETMEAKKFAQQWDALVIKVERFTAKIGIMLLPVLEKLFDRFNKWWAKNHEVAEKGFKTFIDHVMSLSKWMGKLIDHAELFIGLWIGGKLFSGLSAILGVFTKLSGVMLTMSATAAEMAATEAVAAGATGAATGAGIMGLLARFLPPPLMGLLAALYVLKPKAANDTDEVKAIKDFKYGEAGQSDWAKKLYKLSNPEKANAKVNMAYLEKNGTSPELLQQLRNLQEGKSPTVNQTNNVTIQTPDAYSAGRETVYQLERYANPALAGTWR